MTATAGRENPELLRALEELNDRLDQLAPRPRDALMTVDEVAAHLRVTRDWVYRHASELGGRRLPSAKGQGALRFTLADLEQRLRPLAEPTRAKPRATTRRRRSQSRGVELLPIRGGQP